MCKLYGLLQTGGKISLWKMLRQIVCRYIRLTLISIDSVDGFSLISLKWWLRMCLWHCINHRQMLQAVNWFQSSVSVYYIIQQELVRKKTCYRLVPHIREEFSIKLWQCCENENACCQYLYFNCFFCSPFELTLWILRQNCARTCIFDLPYFKPFIPSFTFSVLNWSEWFLRPHHRLLIVLKK